MSARYTSFIARRILAVSIIAIGLFLRLFLSLYSGILSQYRIIYHIIGYGIIVAGAWIFKNTLTIKEIKQKDAINKKITYLKQNGEKIKVDLSVCEIKENTFTEEVDRGNPGEYLNLVKSIGAESKLKGPLGNRIDKVEITESVIIYNTTLHNKSERFISQVIPIERNTLMFKILAKKETFIYIDKQDRASYYFDVEFLFD